MSSRGSRAGAWAAPGLALLALFLGGAALLAKRTTFLVHECVSAGALGRLGLRVTFVSGDAVCPAGTVPGDGRHVVGLVVAVALPVLIGHLVGAALGVGAASRLHRALRALVAAVRALPVAIVDPTAPAVAPATAVDVPVRRPGTRTAAAVPWRRGPPAAGLA